MAYDKNIPDVLQLLRLDLSDGNYDVLMDTTIARYDALTDEQKEAVSDVAVLKESGILLQTW